MTTVTKTSEAEKAPQEPKAEKPQKPQKPQKATKAQKLSSAPLALGGMPRADLLPPEVRAAQRGKAVVRMLVIFVVTVAVVVAGAVGYSTIRSITSQAFLGIERERSNELIARQLDFAEARSIANEVDAAIEARRLGTTTEIDWKAYLDEVSATLPVGVTLSNLTIAPVAIDPATAESENPLEQAAVAKISITAFSLTVPDVEAWFDDLEGLSGFAGIAPPATVAGTPGEGYNVTLELLVNEEAYLLRFQEDEDE